MTNPYHWLIFCKDSLLAYWQNSFLLLGEHLFSQGVFHAGETEVSVMVVAVGLPVAARASYLLLKNEYKIGYSGVRR